MFSFEGEGASYEDCKQEMVKMMEDGVHAELLSKDHLIMHAFVLNGCQLVDATKSLRE